MFQYIAALWQPENAVAQHKVQTIRAALATAQPAWQPVFQQAGAAVWVSGVRPGCSEVYQLADNAGVVLGRLFQTDTAGVSRPAALNLSQSESSSILTSQGRHLVERYWGRYTAVLRDPAGGSCIVLRDPIAYSPCFSATADHVQLYFSRTHDVRTFLPAKLTLDWDYVGATLVMNPLVINQTGIKEITELLGGEAVVHEAGETRRELYWQPLKIANTDVFDDIDVAATAVRRIAHDCVQAWASGYPKLVHTLSGGLDSSIVMACLKNAASRPQITALNYYSSDADGDERSFARQMLQPAGNWQMLERQRNPQLDFSELDQAHLECKPLLLFLYFLENTQLEARIAAEQGATAIFFGSGGDQVFYQDIAKYAVADFCHYRGLKSGLFTTAWDAARIDRLSIWQVLWEGFAERITGKRWSLLADAGRWSTLLHPDLVASVQKQDAWLHPLFRNPIACPSGKLFHAYTMLQAAAPYSPLATAQDEPEQVAPLFSQPLVEVLLRIPIHLHIAGGWSRSIARRAFQHDMPQGIILRNTKGGMEEHAKTAFQRNISTVRELLHDGELAKRGVLDRDKLNTVLSAEPNRISASNVELYESFAVERWARQWQSIAAQ